MASATCWPSWYLLVALVGHFWWLPVEIMRQFSVELDSKVKSMRCLMANVMLGARWLLNSMAYCGPSSYTSENWWPKQREQSLSTGPDSIVILLVQCAVLIKSWWSAQGTELNSDCSVTYAFFTFKTSESQSHFRCGWSDLAWRDFLPQSETGLTWHEEISYHSQRLACLGMKRFLATVRDWPDLAWRDFLPQPETGLTWHEEISCHSQRLAWLGMKKFPTTVRGWPDLAWRNFLPQSEVGLKRFTTTVRGWPDLAWRNFLPQSEVGLKRFTTTVRGWPDLAWRNFLPQSEVGLKRFTTTVRGWPDLAWRNFLPQSEVGLKRFTTTVRGWPDLAWRNFLPQSEGWKFSWKSSAWSRLLAWHWFGKVTLHLSMKKKANTVTANSITSEHEVGDCLNGPHSNLQATQQYAPRLYTCIRNSFIWTYSLVTRVSGLLRFHCLWLETKWDVSFHSHALSCHGVEDLVHLFLNCIYSYTSEGYECSWNRSSILIPVSSFLVCVDLRHLRPSLTPISEVSEWLLCVSVCVCVCVNLTLTDLDAADFCWLEV